VGSIVLNVASRSSRLARVQTDEALEILKPVLPEGTRIEKITVTTPGDRDQRATLGDPAVPDDFFTRDVDDALLAGQADLAVHSAKDLPKTLRAGLVVAALLPARDIRDTLVFRKGLSGDAEPATIGTSSPKREQELARLHPKAQRLPLRGTIDQRLEKLDRGEFDAIVAAACALERLGLADRITRYLDYDPVPQQGRLAVVVRDARPDLVGALRRVDVRRRAGLVALVGCPADAALLSTRARRYLDEADIVLHDRLLPDDVLLAIHDKSLPVGKAGGHRSTAQAEIHRLMLREAEAGKLVVRLHGGDPGVYGHLAEELDFLTSWNLRVDVVPAVTAIQVAAADARAPLTQRGSGHRVTLISARPTPGFEEPIPPPDVGNLAVYMGVSSAAKLEREFLASGWPCETPLVVGERLGYRDERITASTLGQLHELELETPAVFLVGMRAFPNTSTTLFVGTDPELFIRHGPLIHWPLIRLVARPLKERAGHVRKLLPDVHGVIFPSKFAVRTFMEALMSDQDARALSGRRLLAVGPATAEEMARFGLRADGAADNFGGVQALAKKLKGDFAGRYLYPCSDAAPLHERAESLKEHGIELVPSCFYMNRETPYAELPRRAFHRVLFTSTTTVRAYFKNYPHELKAARTWLAVGPSTLRALQQLGLQGETLDGDG
jgi:uroporphyrinogen III methyltransferase/synthase